MEEQDDLPSINFKALISVIWDKKWLIVGITSFITLGGAFYAFTAKEEFIAEGKILPEISGGAGSKLGGLAGLAALGGFDINSAGGSEAIRPDLYPDLIKSTPFFLDLFEQKFVNKNGDSIVFNAFYRSIIEDGKEPKEKLLKTFAGKPSGVIVVNQLTENRINDLKERINGSIDKRSGVIKITVKLPDPVLAAEIAKYAMNFLTDYVTDYRTEKIKREVDFLGRKVAGAKGEFYRDQSRKASYADQFAAPTIRLQSADVQRERIESEYRMSSTVYNELLKKYEEAKIKLQQETPVFKVLEPPVVPNKKNEPKKALILVISVLVGIFISFLIVIIIQKNYQKIIV